MKETINIILKKSKKPLTLEAIYQAIEKIREGEDNSSLSSLEKEEIQTVLSEGTLLYDYYKTPNGRYTLLSKTSFRIGKFRGSRSGEGVVYVTYSYTDRDGNLVTKEEKVGISKDHCNHAIDGDMVLIDIGGNGCKPSVEKIINRNTENIVGEITRIGNQFFVKAIDKKKQDLNIALEGEEYIEGQLVSVSLDEERSPNFYIGKIQREFSHKYDPHADVLFEAFKCGMPEGFSAASLSQLKTIPRSVSPEEMVGRYDLTDWEFFSIDGVTTKDKDDCIFFKNLPNGHVLLGGSIVDTPHYVPFGSPLDRDVFRKGNSYYFGGCVEPQLPKDLSMGICSLQDGFLRLTKTTFIEYTGDGKAVKRWLIPSGIKSRIGMTYEKVNPLLKEGIVEPEYLKYVDTLKDMASFAAVLNHDRMQKGAVKFYNPEPDFLRDENGVAYDTFLRRQDIAEGIIEEFMLAINYNDAKILQEQGIPFVCRVEEAPNQRLLTNYLRLLDVLGIPFNYTAEQICKDKRLFQLLTDHIQNRGYLTVMLNKNLIRCMSHAFYASSDCNIGHYGVGYDIYLHGTSTARRLADHVNSQIIDECYFEKDPDKKKKAIRKWRDLVPIYASQASRMERIAETIERNTKMLDTAVYLQQFIGQDFEATVISVGDDGLTIQLDSCLEGKVRKSYLPGDYVYNPETFTLLSLNGYDSYYIGDRLKLRLEATDKMFKSVDFSVIEKICENRIDDFANSNKKAKHQAYQKRLMSEV